MTEHALFRLTLHEAEASPGLAEWLVTEGLSVGLTCGAQLFLAGVRADGSLRITDRQYGTCTGLARTGPDALLLATRFQIWRLENALPAGALTEDGHDRLFVPQTAWTTGYLAVHELAPDADGRPVFANGRFSCLSGVSERLSFEPRWLPPFVSALASEGRCHLTGLAMEGGRPAYVTCAAPTDAPEGWRPFRHDGGVVVRVADGETVCAGLSMPHSPRLHEGRLWLANGGTGELGIVDLDAGHFEAVAALPGFTRGLDFHGRFALVGASRPPRGETFEGLPLQERLDRAGQDPAAGFFAVDLDRGRVEHSLVLHGGSPEVYAVTALPGVRSPAAVGIQGDEIQDLVTMPRPG